MSVPTFRATLACGCALSFRDGVAGSPVTVVITRKSETCVLPIHVADLPVYDHRELSARPRG